MQEPRLSNMLIRAFVLIFASIGIFLLGSIFFNLSRQSRENPKLDQPEQGLLK